MYSVIVKLFDCKGTIVAECEFNDEISMFSSLSDTQAFVTRLIGKYPNAVRALVDISLPV